MEMKICTKCGEEKSLSNFYRQSANPSGYTTRCKECMKIARRVKRATDPNRLSKFAEEAKRMRAYNSIESVKVHNREARRLRMTDPYRIARKRVTKNKYEKGPAKYNKGRRSRLIGEDVRESECGNIEVRCKNSSCGQYFTPSNAEVVRRISAIEGKATGNVENNFYCSHACKGSCILYKVSADRLISLFRPIEESDHSGFYDDSGLTSWSTQVKQNANHTCEICGSTESLEAHHIQPKATHPEMALDPANGACLCHHCHMEHGHSDECSTGKIRRCAVR